MLFYLSVFFGFSLLEWFGVMYYQIKWNLAGILGKSQRHWRRLVQVTSSVYTISCNHNIFAHFTLKYSVTVCRVNLSEKVSSFILHSRPATKGNRPRLRLDTRPFCLLQILSPFGSSSQPQERLSQSNH